MSKVLLLCDVDGCVAPMPWEKSLPAGAQPSELDFTLGTIEWNMTLLAADPVTHFVVDEVHEVVFDNGFHRRRVELRLASEMLGRLRGLAAAPNVDFRWLSMWNENTQGVFSDFVGFRAPFLRTRDQASEMYDYFKSWAVAELFESGYEADAVVWLDDQHNRQWVNWSAVEGAVEPRGVLLPGLGVPSLIVRTDPRWGISRGEMAKVEGFVAAVR